MIDGPQLQNALLNLLINARHAMPRGGQLTIEISQAQLDAGYAQGVSGNTHGPICADRRH